MSRGIFGAPGHLRETPDFSALLPPVTVTLLPPPLVFVAEPLTLHSACGRRLLALQGGFEVTGLSPTSIPARPWQLAWTMSGGRPAQNC